MPSFVLLPRRRTCGRPKHSTKRECRAIAAPRVGNDRGIEGRASSAVATALWKRAAYRVACSFRRCFRAAPEGVADCAQQQHSERFGHQSRFAPRGVMLRRVVWLEEEAR
jgi:hypothetical protein